MSKAFGLAGLRLGYLAAHRPLVDALQFLSRGRHPNLSCADQAAARAALAHNDALLVTVDAVKVQRDRIVGALPGDGADQRAQRPFRALRALRRRHVAWQALLDRGVLVRDVGQPGWLRLPPGPGRGDDGSSPP